MKQTKVDWNIVYPFVAIKRKVIFLSMFLIMKADVQKKTWPTSCLLLLCEFLMITFSMYVPGTKPKLVTAQTSC